MSVDLLTEVPLPGFPAERRLWAVLIHGPEKIVAQVDRWAADKEAAGINDWLDTLCREDRLDPVLARFLTRWTSAEVIEWPGLRSTHAEELAQRIAEENE